MHIFYNPFATHPISHEYFDRNEVTHHDFDLKAGMPLIETHDGVLLQRSTFKMNKATSQVRRELYKAMEKANEELERESPDSDKPLSIKDLFDLINENN